MKKGRWKVEADGTILIPEVYNRYKKIVYLDDHRLIRMGVIEHCIKPMFSNVQVTEIEDGAVALDFIIQHVGLGEKIDLFITDINHPGLSGIEVSKAIRENERLTVSTHRIPIIIISMSENPRLPELKMENIIDAYFCKADEPDLIMEKMEELLLMEQ